MSEDLKTKVVDTIDSLIPKGQNSLSLREADVVYGINKAKEAVEKLFAEISTQDGISRQSVLNAIDDIESEAADGDGFQYDKWRQYFCELPSAEPERKKGMWTTEQVAEMLANLFGDECACNCNGIDEWLPSACKYADTQCPDPKEKHGCWMQFLIQGGGGTGE